MPAVYTGLAGLSAAFYLAAAGHQPILLEANEYLGGKVCCRLTVACSLEDPTLTLEPVGANVDSGVLYD